MDSIDGIRVNMSGKEGASKTLEPLPSGRYVMAITDCDLDECGPTSKNPGKPMFKIELTVQEGQYENRKAWTNVMLFEGALYSISQMLQAQGVEVKVLGESAEFQVPGFEPNVIPGAEWWMSKQFLIRIKLMPPRKDPDSGKTYDEKSEVKGYMSVKDNGPTIGSTAGWGRATKGARQSLLP